MLGGVAEIAEIVSCEVTAVLDDERLTFLVEADCLRDELLSTFLQVSGDYLSLVAQLVHWSASANAADLRLRIVYFTNRLLFV